jgi:hypothetical protein
MDYIWKWFDLMTGILNSTYGTQSDTIVQSGLSATFIGVSSISNQTASTTAVAPALTTLQVNDKIIAFVAWKPSGNQTPTTTIASGTGATVTWTDLGVYSQPATTTATDILTRVWIGNVTAITTGSSTTTVTFSAAAINALQVRSFRNLTTTQRNVVQQGRGNSTTNGLAGSTNATGTIGDLIIYYAADNQQLGTATYGTVTTNGTFSTGLTSDPAASAGSNAMLMSQYKILTASGLSGACLANNAGVTAGPWAYQIFVFAHA